MKYKLFLFLIMLLLPLWITAQTQQGYVKSLGRPEKQGEPLEGVTLRVKGSHNTVVSDPNGNFSLLFTDLKNGDAYSIQQVKKNGYELNEIDFIGRKLAFSEKVPLTIVMVSSEQLRADKLHIEDNAYKTAEKNYKAKMSLIEKQMRDNEITKEQYQAAINNLQDKFEKYQSLIDGLAMHYAHTDYDMLDEKDQEINLCIENGDLERADSLIRTLFDPIDVLKRNMDALADIEQQIGQARGIITQANADMEAVLKQQEKDAEYLYQLYTIAAARFDNDKALQYIETRAELDTTRWEWQYDAGGYCYKQNLIGKAEKYYNRALDRLDEILKVAFDSDIENANKEDIAQVISLSTFTYVLENNLAFIYYKTNRFAESEESYLDIINFFKSFSNYTSTPEVAIDLFGGLVLTSMSGLSNLYRDTNRLEESIALCQESLEIMRQLKPDDVLYVEDMKKQEAQILMTQGLNYKKDLRYEESEKCFKEALEIHRHIAKTNPDNEVEVARTLHNYGNLCSDMKRYDDSKSMLLESLKIYRRLTKANPAAFEVQLAMVLGDLALTYDYLERYEESEKLYKEAIDINRKWAQSHPTLFEPNLAWSLGNLGSLYLYHNERYTESIPPLEEAFEIYQRLNQVVPEVYGKKLSISKFNLANAYYKSGQIKESLPFWVEILDEFNKLVEDDSEIIEHYEKTTVFVKELAPWLDSEAADFKDEGKYEESEIYYKSALDLYRCLAQSDPNTYEPEIAGTLNGLAILYANAKQFSKSEAAFTEALETYQRLAKTNPKTYQHEVFRMRNNLAALEVNKAQDYNGKKQYEEAAACYVKVIEIRKGLAKEDQISNYNYYSEIAKALNSLAIVYVDLNRYQESEAAFKESLEIYQRLSQTDAAKYESSVTQALSNLSILASQLRKKVNQNKDAQQYEESQAMLSQALGIYRYLAQIDPEKYNPEIATTLTEIEQARKQHKD